MNGKKRISRGFAITLAAAAAMVAEPAQSGYGGPGTQPCRTAGFIGLPHHYGVHFIDDDETKAEPYSRTVGSQLVASILTGSAIWRLINAPDGAIRDRRMRYICLLADDSTVVFFYWLDESRESKK